MGCSNHPVKSSQTTEFIKDSATNDTPVETLKTLSSEISSVEQQNRDLVSLNKSLLQQDKTTLDQFKKNLLAKVNNEIQSTKLQLKQQNDSKTNSDEKAIENNPEEFTEHGAAHSPLGKNEKKVLAELENPDSDSQLTWVSDLQNTSSCRESLSNQNHSQGLDVLLNPGNVNHHDEACNQNNVKAINNVTNNTDFLKNIYQGKSDDPINNFSKKINAISYYTLPVNATLTGAIAMQPLIGRIPIDGKVPDPYTFKAIIGSKNLAANGVDIPSNIQGIVVSGIAEGDMLGECARGEITSMTFVFQDGRISTTKAKDNQSLGNIAAANGNPCIAGSFHSDAALFLGATAGLAGFQGYGNALSQSQLSNVTSNQTGSTIATLIGSANKYAVGQGFSASSQAAQKWWNQRVQNSFDFVYVPNVDPKTGKKLQLNINITQEIPIDYDPKARKLFYAHDKLSDVAEKLD
jgi:integrating conjugative element protein (TIGR03752 family)